MDVTLPKKELLRLFGRTQGVADKKSTMPILSNVLISAEKDGLLRASATDLFMAVTTTAPAEVKRTGTIAVSAKELIERLKAMPEGPVSIGSTEGATVLIKAVGGKREFRLRGMPGEDFPALPKPDASATEATISANVLADLIGRTHFSISADETRPHLNSALFEWDGDTVRMVTTDGHRLSKYEVTSEGGQKSAFSLLVPLKGILELRRICDELKSEGSPPLRLLRGGPNVFFATNDSTLAIKLVDAQFPPYQQVIPQRVESHVAIGRASMIDVLRAMSVAASERTGSVKIGIQKGLMRVTSENPESGDAFDEIPVDYAGAEMTIGFNVRYLLDALSALEEDEIKLGLSGELDPVMIEPLSARKFVAIVMPMRI